MLTLATGMNPKTSTPFCVCRGSKVSASMGTQLEPNRQALTRSSFKTGSSSSWPFAPSCPFWLARVGWVCVPAKGNMSGSSPSRCVALSWVELACVFSGAAAAGLTTYVL